MFVQNLIELSAVVHELSWSRGKKSDENNTVHRYCGLPDSNNMYVRCWIIKPAIFGGLNSVFNLKKID